MKSFLIDWFVTAVAAAIMVAILPGFSVVGDNALMSYLCFALFMSLINASIKPFMKLISLPITVLSFGLFSLVINVVCLELAGNLAISIFGFGITFTGFFWGLLGAFVLSIVSSILNSILINY